MIIYFEGFRCSGKTTLIENCNGDNIVRILRTLPKGKVDLTPVDFMRQDEQKCQLAFSQPKSKLVLVDRCYLSTVLYYTVMQEENPGFSAWPVYEWLIKNLGIKLYRPDLYIFLNTPIDVCLERIKQSRTLKPNDLWAKSPEKILYWYKRLFTVFEFGVPFYELDGEGDKGEVAIRFGSLLSQIVRNQ
jgi:thymidylate kinase